jgi:outer membrane protein TolC
MHCVYGMRGSSKWHENGELTQLDNPAWRDYLADYMKHSGDGVYVIDLRDSLQLALLHSPGYQSSVESLYGSALDVAFERFRFDLQFFAGTRTSWLHRGSEPSGESSSTLTHVNGASAGGSGSRGGKLLPAGGQVLVDFANTFVWQFAGPNENTRADSLLSFTFLQPFLRQGGREVAMEQLTVAERGLLANVRQMERYRQGFLLNVAMGTGNLGGPARQGGFLGGAGLSGFTGQGAGGFAGVGEGTNFGRLGGGVGTGGGGGGGGAQGFAAGIAGNVNGFIGLAQTGQQIRNREANLALQLENLARMEELFQAGRIPNTQVLQFRQNLQTTQSQYLSAVNQYQAQLENFLTSTLGLPPDLPVRVDQSIVRPFQFTDPTLAELRKEVSALTAKIRIEEDPALETVAESLRAFESLYGPITERFEAVRKDFEKLSAVEAQRLALLADDEARREFLEQVNALKTQFKSLESKFTALRDGAQKVKVQLKPESRKEAAQNLISQYDALSDMLLELGFNQAGALLEAIILPAIRLDSEEAFQIARANRLDIMNQRAEVVDQWRFIEFLADRLEADLNVELNGSIGTLDRNIVKFRDQTGSFSASVRFDTPITRLGERNVYRQSLIDYQRVRRGYIQFEDGVKMRLRGTLRSVTIFEKEIELRRRAMRIAIQQMDFNQARLKEPPRVGAAGAAGGDPVRDLLQAFSDFLETQNGVLNTYLSYQALRMSLYLDLGIIRFDENGMWIDEPIEAALQRLSEQGEPYFPPACPPIMLDLVSPASADTSATEHPSAEPEAGTATQADGAKTREGKSLRTRFLPRRRTGDPTLKAPPTAELAESTSPAAAEDSIR